METVYLLKQKAIMKSDDLLSCWEERSGFNLPPKALNQNDKYV
jgi:hypothetical protein